MDRINSRSRPSLVPFHFKLLVTACGFFVLTTIQPAKVNEKYRLEASVTAETLVGHVQEKWAAQRAAEVANGRNATPLDVLDLEDPLKLYLTKINATAVIGSAILQEDKVIFVVYDCFAHQCCFRCEKSIQALSTKFLCSFEPLGSVLGDVGNQSCSGEKQYSPLQVYHTNSIVYKSTSIWMCPLPEGHKQCFTSVRIVTPPWVKHNGSSKFQLSETNWNGNIVSCGKVVYGFSNSTKRILKEYIQHYQRLDVDKFVFYVIEGEDRLAVERELSRMQGDVTLIVIPKLMEPFFGLRNAVPPFFSQRLTVNDCLYRAKASNIPWHMMMFDLDEFLIGVDKLPAELASWPKKALHVPHYHVHPNSKASMMQNDKPILISSKPSKDMGKTIARTDWVDVSFVHYPTSPYVLPTNEKWQKKGLKLLHFRSGKTIYNNTNWTKFSFNVQVP